MRQAILNNLLGQNVSQLKTKMRQLQRNATHKICSKVYC